MPPAPHAPSAQSNRPVRYNARAVARRVRRLTRTYDDVTVVTEREEPRGEFDRLREHAEEGYIGGAYCWTVRESGQQCEDGRTERDSDADNTESRRPDAGESKGSRRRVLLGMRRDRDSWCPPGGEVKGFDPDDADSGERYEEAATRWVREETGVDAEPTECVFVHWAIVEDPCSEAEVHLAYAVFDAAYCGGRVTIEPDQLNGAAWFADLPPNLHYFAQQRADTWSA
ncbi:NUDIX domain-containing protein [Haloarchaeobius sp. TZWWS8]|uniref:NUDIX domain-containing protein n=1 Tax=Haloarchaeobius sp. TZWWS8 TaxID=3446121 RepID=UPI003EBBA6CD